MKVAKRLWVFMIDPRFYPLAKRTNDQLIRAGCLATAVVLIFFLSPPMLIELFILRKTNTAQPQTQVGGNERRCPGEGGALTLDYRIPDIFIAHLRGGSSGNFHEMRPVWLLDFHSITNTAAPWSWPRRRLSRAWLACSNRKACTSVLTGTRGARARNSSPSWRGRVATERIMRSSHSRL